MWDELGEEPTLELPVLDIKPYVPEFDEHTDIRIGWLEQARGKARFTRSDRRF